jgi:hypothetical protein
MQADNLVTHDHASRAQKTLPYDFTTSWSLGQWRVLKELNLILFIRFRCSTIGGLRLS